MVKTVLLCFIHGFKGDDETFFQFPEDLRNLVAEVKPNLDVRTVVYPKYETKGDLAACVETFREWLQDQVTDLEQNAATPQAILNPSVGVILVAHSMGGFVATDTLFSVLDNRPVSADPNIKLMFPLIQGVISFDTPYNGLSRSMFAYGAFSQYQNLSSIWSIGSSVGSLLSGTGAITASSQIVAGQSSSWKRWQLLAARTGTYGAIIAGGVAAYVNRAEIAQSLSKVNKQTISESWSKVNRDSVMEGLSQVPAYVSRDSIGEGFSWMASHLKFVGVLMKQAQLKTRLDRMSQVRGVGMMNFYTSLGENGYWAGGYFVPKRTFCAIPTGTDAQQIFREQPNTKANDEIAAHVSMFRPEKNEIYKDMAKAARDIVVDWLKNDPRNAIDDYKPSPQQRERSMSEAQLWDDDGKVLGQKETRNEGNEEDELQCQAILNSTGMPEPTDGGISDEDLEKAASLPLPMEEVSDEAMQGLWDGVGDKPKTWRSGVPNPFSKVSMPSMPAMPVIPAMPRIPSIPAVRIPGLRKQESAAVGNVDSTKQTTEASSSEDQTTRQGEVNEVAEPKSDTPEASQVGRPADIPNEEGAKDGPTTQMGITQGDKVQKVDEMSKEGTGIAQEEEAKGTGKIDKEASLPIKE